MVMAESPIPFNAGANKKTFMGMIADQRQQYMLSSRPHFRCNERTIGLRLHCPSAVASI
jgi:hypothetical protein